MSRILEVEGLSAGYLGEDVIHDMNLHVEAGEAVGVIGSNGAGKTTLLRSLAGLSPISGGRVRLAGSDITNTPGFRVSRSGLAYVPAERRLFPTMSVHENLLLGAYPGRPDRHTLAFVMDTFPRLRERARQHAGTLSGGEQQMLVVGRALMTKPDLLVLDEPTTGLAPLLAQQAYDVLKRLREQGMTVLVAEQQVPLALDLVSRAYVVDHGRITLAGTSAELVANPAVREAYLGV